MGIRLALVVFCGACSFVPRANLEPGADEALVLATVTMRNEGDFFERADFYFERVGGGRRFRLDSAVPWTMFPSVESVPAAGLEADNGRHHVFPVPAGTYRLRRIGLGPFYAEPGETASFTVDAGRAVYIGNLHVTLCHLRGAGGAYYVRGGHASVVDHRVRDLALLRSAHPELGRFDVVVNLLDDATVRRNYGHLARKCPGTHVRE